MKVEWVQLGGVLTPRVGQSVEADADYPIAGVYGFGRGILLRDSIHGFETKYKTLTRLGEGDVVFSKLKAFEGAITVVPAEGKGCFVSQEFPAFLVSRRVNGRYLDHFLKSPGFLATLAERSTGIGARRERVHPDQFLALPVPIPSRPDQDRIAAHLDSLGAIPLKAEKNVRQAHGLADALREGWLGRLSTETCGRLGDVLRQVDQLGDVDPEAAYPTLGVRGSGRGAFASGTLAGADTTYKRLRRFRANQVCYPKLMAWQGAFSVIPESLDGHFASPEFVGFDVNQEVASVRYIAHILTWPGLLIEATARSSGTNANRRRLQPRDFLNIPIPLPSKQTQAAVASRLDLAVEAVRRAEASEILASAILPAARNEIFDALN